MKNLPRTSASKRLLLMAALCTVVWAWSAAAMAEPRIAIAAFKALGVEKNLSNILGEMRNAYKKHTGEAALNKVAIDQNLGVNGLKVLETCAQKIPCLLKPKKTEQLPASITHALYVGVGGIGGKLLVRYILLDLKAGKALQQVNKSYASIDAFKAALPAEMKAFFPQYATLQISGSPAGAIVYLDNKERGKIPTGKIKATTTRPLSLRVLAAGHQVYNGRLQLKPGKMTKLTLKLKKVVAVVKIQRPPPPRPPAPTTPVTQKGWFWAVVGIGAAAAIGGGVAAIVISQQRPCDVCAPTVLTINKKFTTP